MGLRVFQVCSRVFKGVLGFLEFFKVFFGRERWVWVFWVFWVLRGF